MHMNVDICIYICAYLDISNLVDLTDSTILDFS